MSCPVEITYRNVEASPAIESAIHKGVDSLEPFHDRIIGCRVAVESPHRHQKKGRHFHVHVDVTIPGTEIVANRNPEKHDAHQDVYVSIRDAFRAAKRQLQDFTAIQRGK
jgi:ribosome-associated translation inhibitor RaiA